MHPNLFQDVLWLLYVLGTLAVLIALIRTRAPFPSLFALCSVQLLTSAILFVVKSHYAYYFYIYWTSDFIQSAIRLWLLIDVLRSIPGNSFIHRSFRLVVGTAGVVMAFGAAWVARSGHTVSVISKAQWMWDSVVINEQSVAFFCVTVCLSFFGAVYVLGLGWDRRGAIIACGLGLQMGELALRSLLTSESSHSARMFGEYLDGLTELAVLYLFYKATSPCLEHRVSLQ